MGEKTKLELTLQTYPVIKNPNCVEKIELWIVRVYIRFQNGLLKCLENFLFPRVSKKTPRSILIYKVGNIGDIVCAVPSLIAIRRAYPDAKIVLLTSPGKRGALGARELLETAWYLDVLIIYYTQDLNSFRKKIRFARNLRTKKYDLFIQLPDNAAKFRVLLRNMLFAKAIDVRSAFGFKIRSTLLFRNAQVRFLRSITEVESLIELLKENGIRVRKIEFNFNIPSCERDKVKKILEETWKNAGGRLIVAICLGAKREANKWSLENFKKIVAYLQRAYRAKIVIVGGKEDVRAGETIRRYYLNNNVTVAAGEINLLGTLELFKHCSFLISNDTGAAHLAAAVGIPVVGIYGVRSIFGKWFPYGNQHKILYNRFIDCNYKNESCIKRSIDTVSLERVKRACDELINKIKDS